MDQQARCGMTLRGGLAQAIPSQKHRSAAVLGGFADAFLDGRRSYPGSIQITGTVKGLDNTSPFPGDYIGYATDPVGKFVSTLRLMLDPITGGGTTKVLEFDAGTGGGVGPVDATDVTYQGAYPTVAAALDALFYVPPRINSFSNNVGTVEKGSVVTSVTLNWSFNKTMVSASINQGVGDVLGLTSVHLTGLSLSTDFTWTLTANDGTNGTSASTTISFLNKRFWTASSNPNLQGSDLYSVSQEFTTGRQKAITYDCTGGKYPYYAYPASFGPPANVTVGGLAFSDFTATLFSFTNLSGHTENYYMVRFNNLQTGAAINVVWN